MLGVHSDEHHRHPVGPGAARHQIAPDAADPEGLAGRRILDLATVDCAADMARRYGDVFMLNVPVYGPIVVVANPQLAKQIFTTSPEVLGNIKPNLSRLLGSGSVFALDGDEHRQRRRLLAPPFHGKSIKNYETIIEEETLREIAGLARGQDIPDAAVDDAHHAQRHPARGLRGRRRRAR